METGTYPRALAAAVLTAALSSAQTDWSLVFGNDNARSAHRLACGARSPLVFGGERTIGTSVSLIAETAIWTGSQWSPALPAAEPSPRRWHAMAGDIARGRVVLFGGTSGTLTALGDTWEWDGTNWHQFTPFLSPSPREGSAMACDIVRGRAVLFGGRDPNIGLRQDSWEWDGSTWTQTFPIARPAPRQLHAMAFDLLRGRTVLFGGTGVLGTRFADTWEWDGVAWRLIAPVTSPSPRESPALTFDLTSGKTLLFGGETAALATNDLWSWDGINWTLIRPATASRPSSQTDTAMDYDPATGRVLLHGGMDSQRRSDTWMWDGLTWSQAVLAARSAAGLALNPSTGDGLLFGGIRQLTDTTSELRNDTWRWSNGVWHLLLPASSPPGRHRHAMVFDVARQRTVLFGGASAVTTLGDTWLWDGTNWSQQIVVGPPARSYGSMIYFAARQVVILFGGLSSASQGLLLQDTWAWNGASWSQMSPANVPPARANAPFAYDSTRAVGVIYGGFAGFSTGNDTWEWDGTDWSQRQPAHRPPARIADIAYDVPRRRTVLFLADPWEWDGVDWTQRSAPTPGIIGNALSAFDARMQRVLRVAGQSGIGTTTLGYSYGATRPAALSSFGTGCLGSAGTPTLREATEALPWLGDTLQLRTEPVLPNAPARLAVGLSSTTFAGTALPAPLDVLGMAGCSLLVSIDLESLAIASGSHADFALTMPSSAAFLGLQWFAQAAVLDGAANPAGIVVSDALAGRLGGR